MTRRPQRHNDKMRSVKPDMAISYQFSTTDEWRAHVRNGCPRVLLDYMAKIWRSELSERTLNPNNQQRVTQKLQRAGILSVSVRASKASSLSTWTGCGVRPPIDSSMEMPLEYLKEFWNVLEDVRHRFGSVSCVGRLYDQFVSEARSLRTLVCSKGG